MSSSAVRLRAPGGVAAAVLLSAAVAAVSLAAPRVVALPSAGFVPPSAPTHILMLVLTLSLIALPRLGGRRAFGLTRGSYRFRPIILLWILPTLFLSSVSLFTLPLPPDASAEIGLTAVQVVVWVFVLASVTEELLTRGLLQSLVARFHPPAGRRVVSLPVAVSALFFAAMHLVLIASMGAGAIPVIALAFLLGLVAGRYREASGSLIPAVIVHVLFNLGGVLPLWVAEWIGSVAPSLLVGAVSIG